MTSALAVAPARDLPPELAAAAGTRETTRRRERAPRTNGLYPRHRTGALDPIDGLVPTLVNAIAAKDPQLRAHSERVARIARRLGQELALPADDLRNIHLAGLLHDIGKIGIDDRTLQKLGPLTTDEFRRVQQHPIIGCMILEDVPNLQPVLPGVRSHHESYDGTGYPDRLSGADIPLMARILAVADAFDAMSSDRPYRRGMSLERVERILDRGAGRQWDGRIVDAYFAARHEIARLGGPDDVERHSAPRS